MGRPASVPRSPVGERIAAAREAAGLSQQQLADKLGVSVPNITFWERRAPSPRAEMLVKISDVLGVAVDDLLGRTQSVKKPRGPAGRVRKVFDEVNALPRHQQRKILDVVEALIAQQSNGGS